MADNKHRSNPLYQLLMKACPPNKNGQATVAQLARELGMSRWAIYRWINAQKMEPENVMKVVDIAEGRVTIADFERFVYTL